MILLDGDLTEEGSPDGVLSGIARVLGGRPIFHVTLENSSFFRILVHSLECNFGRLLTLSNTVISLFNTLNLTSSVK